MCLVPERDHWGYGARSTILQGVSTSTARRCGKGAAHCWGQPRRLLPGRRRQPETTERRWQLPGPAGGKTHSNPRLLLAGVCNDNWTKEEAYLRESPTYIISKEFQVQWSWPLHRMWFWVSHQGLRPSRGKCQGTMCKILITSIVL